MGRSGIIVGMALLLGACATTPVSLSDANPVPESRLYAFQGPGTSNDGFVTVIRDEGFMGHGCRINVLIDGTRAAFVGAGEEAKLAVPAGPHILGVHPSDKGLCKINNNSQNRTLKITVLPKHDEQFRLSILGSGDVELSQTTL